MTACSHKVCGKERNIWYPTADRYSSIKRHKYCVECGNIQNLSEDRPRPLGYWMNKLGVLCFQLDLTQCQKRLIAKEIEGTEYFQDSFSSFGSGQKALFIKIVNRHCDASSVDFDSFLQVR
jgi:hypothetical protein